MSSQPSKFQQQVAQQQARLRQQEKRLVVARAQLKDWLAKEKQFEITAPTVAYMFCIFRLFDPSINSKKEFYKQKSALENQVANITSEIDRLKFHLSQSKGYDWDRIPGFRGSVSLTGPGW